MFHVLHVCTGTHCRVAKWAIKWNLRTFKRQQNPYLFCRINKRELGVNFPCGRVLRFLEGFVWRKCVRRSPRTAGEKCCARPSLFRSDAGDALDRLDFGAGLGYYSNFSSFFCTDWARRGAGGCILNLGRGRGIFYQFDGLGFDLWGFNFDRWLYSRFRWASAEKYKSSQKLSQNSLHVWIESYKS